MIYFSFGICSTHINITFNLSFDILSFKLHWWMRLPRLVSGWLLNINIREIVHLYGCLNALRALVYVSLTVKEKWLKAREQGDKCTNTIKQKASNQQQIQIHTHTHTNTTVIVFWGSPSSFESTKWKRRISKENPTKQNEKIRSSKCSKFFWSKLCHT